MMRIIVYLSVFTFNVATATYAFTVAIRFSPGAESWTTIILVALAVLNIISAMNMVSVTKEVIKNK